MTDILESPSPAKPKCDIVPGIAGNPVDQELLEEFTPMIVDDALSDVRLPYEAPESSDPEVAVALEVSRKSGQAMYDLGCAACDFSDSCKVVEVLEQNIESADYLSRLHSTVETLMNGPIWLQKARAMTTGVDTSDPEAQVGVQALLQEAKDPTSGSIEKLEALALGSTTAEIKPITAVATPELEKVDHAKKRTPVKGHRVKTASGKVFDIYDASEAVGFDDSQPTDDEMQKLCAKLLFRLNEVDEKGVSHIFNADGTQQKSVTGWRKRNLPGKLAEVRTSGKARIYVTVPDYDGLKPGEVPRLVILGAHGDNAQMQDRFFTHIGV